MGHRRFFDEQPLKYDPFILRRLLSYTRPYRKALFISLLLVILETAIHLSQPYVLKIAIDDYILGPGSLQGLQRLGIAFLLIYLSGMILHYLQFNILMRTGQRIMNDIRKDIFAHLQKLSIPFFNRNRTGHLVTRVTNDIETLNEMYTSFLVNFIKDIFMLAGIVVILLRLHATMALLTFSAVPAVIVIIAVYRRHARQAFREMRTQLARINSFLSQNIAGIRIVQAFLQERKRSGMFNDINEAHYRAGMKEIQTFAVFRPAMDLLRSLVLALLLWYGSGAVLEGVIPFGLFYAFINYLQYFFRPLNDLSDKYSILESAMASAERIFKLMDEKVEITDPPSPKALHSVRGDIHFHNVWFAYENEKWVLRDINFYARAGEKIAVVGPTGAGKSSFINLINRFYDAQKGAVAIDGINVKELALKELRRRVGVIHQDVFLFNGSIRENITLNALSLSPAQLERVAREANAYEFIEQLPQKFDTPVGERGVTLSTGQRQLLAFARILAFDPAIFIFDEATAHIDSHTESLLQKTLQHVTRGRTSIIIAHRLSTVRKAERIFLMQRGRLTEMESFERLAANLERYFKAV